MSYFLELSTSNGKGQIVFCQTCPVEGADVDVLDDVLTYISEMMPAFSSILDYIYDLNDKNKTSDAHKANATEHVKALVHAAVLSPNARSQLDYAVQQCYVGDHIDYIKLMYIHHLYMTLVGYMSKVSAVINSGANDIQIGQSSHTEGVFVEIVVDED